MSTDGAFHESAAAVFAELDAIAPGVPLAAFGQTIFWDEPMKRILLEARDAARSERDALVGVHDLDYFSRMPGAEGGGYGVLTHNDVETREIWSAAGELSALFGCEVWPSRQRLNELKLRLNVALGPELDGLDRVTEAWGWRAVAQLGGDAAVVRDLPLDDVLPPLENLLAWGLEESAACLAEAASRARARRLGKRIVQQFRRVAKEKDVRSISDLFLRLLPYVWDLLGCFGDASAEGPRKTATRTSDVLCLNRATAHLPRFRLLDVFLDPDTAQPAREAYDQAVQGAAMYALGEFGAGAIPFDLYVPGRGRGTLFLLQGHVVAHTTPRTVIEVDRPVCTTQCLAKAIEEQVGKNVAVVGKAVTLAAMLASEFVFALNETGSAYMDRTASLVQGLLARGIDFSVHPVLRVQYHTWDALRHVDARLRLPDHLAQAFGKPRVTACEFAKGWRHAVRQQESLLRALRDLRSSADILSFLSDDQQDKWYKRLRQCQAAQAKLLDIQHRVSDLKRQAMEIRDKEDVALEAVQTLERKRGKLNREVLKPLRRRLEAALCRSDRDRLSKRLAKTEREHEVVVAEMGARQAERDGLAAERKETTQAFRRLERGEEARRARKALSRVERDAERQRLELARNAILASEGLPRAELRPSAWWFPLVDPEGTWYAQVRRTAEFRLERLDAQG